MNQQKNCNCINNTVCKECRPEQFSFQPTTNETIAEQIIKGNLDILKKIPQEDYSTKIQKIIDKVECLLRELSQSGHAIRKQALNDVLSILKNEL